MVRPRPFTTADQSNDTQQRAPLQLSAEQSNFGTNCDGETKTLGHEGTTKETGSQPSKNSPALKAQHQSCRIFEKGTVLVILVRTASSHKLASRAFFIGYEQCFSRFWVGVYSRFTCRLNKLCSSMCLV